MIFGTCQVTHKMQHLHLADLNPHSGKFSQASQLVVVMRDTCTCVLNLLFCSRANVSVKKNLKVIY